MLAKESICVEVTTVGDAKNVVQSQTKMWNDHNREGWAAGFADTAELRAPGGVSGSGAEMGGQFYDIWTDAFPDNQVDQAIISEDGENGILEAVFKGTHTGPLNAPSGTIPATGKTVAIPFVVAAKVDRGKFSSFHLYFDQVELVNQLGVG